MLKSVTNYFESYNNEVQKPYKAWSKEHWKGTVLLNVVAYGSVIGVIKTYENRDEIKNKLKKIIKK